MSVGNRGERGCGADAGCTPTPAQARNADPLRALAAEQHEEWLDGARYLDMQPLADLSKTRLQLAA